MGGLGFLEKVLATTLGATGLFEVIRQFVEGDLAEHAAASEVRLIGEQATRHEWARLYLEQIPDGRALTRWDVANIEQLVIESAREKRRAFERYIESP